MALQFIAGRSGSGKSHYIYSRIIEEAQKDRNARFFVCVPDQFTMQTQKNLVDLHPSHCIMNIDVLSFNRLAARVFDEVGFSEGTILEDMGKTLLLQKVVWDQKRNISVLGKTMNRPGGVEEMKSLVSEFLQYRVLPGDLSDYSKEAGVSPLLSRKLEELELIYQGLKDRYAGKYLAAEEVCEALSTVIGQSERIKGATFVFDGFTGFVPVQLMVLREILKLAKDVKIVVTAGEKNGLFRKSRPTDLFHMSHQMADSLRVLAGEEKVPVEDTVWIRQGNISDAQKPGETETAGIRRDRFAGSAPLAFLEENLFRNPKARYEEAQDDIRILCASNKEDEIACAAGSISRLIRTGQYRYRDIAVICADISAYGRSMQRYLEDCGIPCFLDEKHSVLSNPLVQFIKGAADIIADDFSYDSVFTYLRSGLSGLGTGEIDRMENYVLAAGIQGYKKYNSIWTKKPKTFEEEDVIELNTLRERLMDELAEVTAVFKTRMSPVGEKTKALYRLAVACGVQQKLKKAEVSFAAAGNKGKEREYAQIYKAVIDLFDKLVEILGEEKIGTAAYSKLLEAGFTQMKLGLIPTGPDEIFIGDIERSRVKNVKVLIFLGLNDGLVPKRSATAGLLNENDREVLKGAGLALAPSEKENMFRQRFYLYLNLTLSSEKIFLFYKKTDEDGSGCLPSYLIGTIQKMFPQLEIRSSDPGLMLETRPGRRTALLSSLQEVRKERDPASFLELYLGLKQDPAEEPLTEELLRGAGIARKDTDIDSRTAEEIYEDRYSVTRLQLFANCAFAHFLRYGLKLGERQIYELQASDIGSIFHDVIKNFFLLAREEGGVSALSARQTEELTEKAFEETIGAYNSTVMLESARDLAQTARMKRMIQTTIRAVKRQLEAGEFVTEGIEAPYGIGKLTGTIDRYDVCRFGDTAYVRVIDYKSGNTKINYTGMYYGLQIQLPVYLNAALDQVGKNADAKAAGVYYLGIRTPMIEADSMDEEIGYEKFLKEMRFSGLTLDDPAIIEKQDKDAISGTVLPVRITKKGTFYKGTPVISEGDFRLIERYTKRLVKDLEEEIRKGKAGIAPAAESSGDEGHCQYCEYKDVCGYDPKIPGFRHRMLEKFDKNTICPAMSKKVESGN